MINTFTIPTELLEQISAASGVSVEDNKTLCDALNVMLELMPCDTWDKLFLMLDNDKCLFMRGNEFDVMKDGHTARYVCAWVDGIVSNGYEVMAREMLE